jgi:hypothetical protein
MKRHPSETKGGRLRIAPFIMTCTTATYFGPIQEFLADSHRKRVYLPLNRLQPPTWKNDNSPVLNNSPATSLLVRDVGGHARAMELIADELAKYRNKLEPNITELANALYAKLTDRYEEAVSVLEGYAFPIVQCILSRQQIRLQDVIPGSDIRWEHVTASRLTWFERNRTGYGSSGYLVAPYIWIWMLARLQTPKNTRSFMPVSKKLAIQRLRRASSSYDRRRTPGNSTWQSFEVFCCSFRILRSLGFGDGQEVPLEFLHFGCKLRDDGKTMVVNRHLNFTEAVHQYGTDSMARKNIATRKARSAEEVDTQHSGNFERGRPVIPCRPQRHECRGRRFLPQYRDSYTAGSKWEG